LDEVDEDLQDDFPLPGQFMQNLQLREIAIDQRHPCFFMPRVAMFGLVKHPRDYLLGRSLQAGPNTFVFRPEQFLRRFPNRRQNILRGSHEWLDGVDRSNRCHAFGVHPSAPTES
jgi:hypothetical protein